MTARTDKQLEGAKKTASGAPVEKKRKTPAKKSAGRTRRAAAAKKPRVTSQLDHADLTAEVTLENEKPQPGKADPIEETPKEIDAGGAESTNENAVTEGTPETGDEGTSKSSGAKGATGGGDTVKPLTEAGKKRLVNKLLGLAETQATQGGFKITPADLIRLMQLHKEMTPQRDRKVTVQWVEDKPE
jgi:hypothetical protein